MTKPMSREMRDACWAIVKDSKGMEATGHAAAVRWARAALGLDDRKREREPEEATR